MFYISVYNPFLEPFVEGVRPTSSFFFPFFGHVDVQLFQHHLLKNLSLLHGIAFDPVKDQLTIFIGSISRLS